LNKSSFRKNEWLDTHYSISHKVDRNTLRLELLARCLQTCSDSQSNLLWLAQHRPALPRLPTSCYGHARSTRTSCLLPSAAAPLCEQPGRAENSNQLSESGFPFDRAKNFISHLHNKNRKFLVIALASANQSHSYRIGARRSKPTRASLYEVAVESVQTLVSGILLHLNGKKKKERTPPKKTYHLFANEEWDEKEDEEKQGHRDWNRSSVHFIISSGLSSSPTRFFCYHVEHSEVERIPHRRRQSEPTLHQFFSMVTTCRSLGNAHDAEHEKPDPFRQWLRASPGVLG